MRWPNTSNPIKAFFTIFILTSSFTLTLIPNAWDIAHSAKATYRNFDVKRFWETYAGIPVPNVDAESFYALEREWEDTKRRYATKAVIDKIENARREWRAKLLELDRELHETFEQAEKDAEVRAIVLFFNLIALAASTVDTLSKAEIAKSSDGSTDSESGKKLPEGSIIIDEKYERATKVVIDGKVKTLSTQQILIRHIKNPDAAGNPLGREMLGVVNQYIDKLPFPNCNSNLEACGSLPSGSKLETSGGTDNVNVFAPPDRKLTNDEKELFKTIKRMFQKTLDLTVVGDVYTYGTGKNLATGEEVSTSEKALALASVGLFVGTGGRTAGISVRKPIQKALSNKTVNSLFKKTFRGLKKIRSEKADPNSFYVTLRKDVKLDLPKEYLPTLGRLNRWGDNKLPINNKVMELVKKKKDVLKMYVPKSTTYEQIKQIGVNFVCRGKVSNCKYGFREYGNKTILFNKERNLRFRVGYKKIKGNRVPEGNAEKGFSKKLSSKSPSKMKSAPLNNMHIRPYGK